MRSIYADWEGGDWSRVEWADPDLEFVATGGNEAGTWTGLSELAKTLRDRLSVFDNAFVRAEQYREVDDERVLALLTLGGRSSRACA